MPCFHHTATRGGGASVGWCYMHVPQVPVAYSKATWAAFRRAHDVFDLPWRNGNCIPQLQETAHVFTMDMPLTPQMPECFFPSAVAANVPHDVDVAGSPASLSYSTLMQQTNPIGLTKQATRTQCIRVE